MSFAKSFRELDVYQNGLKLVVDVHGFCETLPTKERYALADQMRRAPRSVCSNVAEAWRKRGDEAAFVSKLSDAETESAEMQSWLDVARALGYLDVAQHKDLDARYEQVLSQLVSMIARSKQWCTL
jgi:four helix bundle protein